MRLVVADTSPLRYLVQIDEIELLPRLFEKVFVPSILCDELSHPSTPEAVRGWIASRPTWLDLSVVRASHDPSFISLDQSENAAITLGL